MRKLISTSKEKKKEQVRNEWSNILPNILASEEKSTKHELLPRHIGDTYSVKPPHQFPYVDSLTLKALIRARLEAETLGPRAGRKGLHKPRQVSLHTD